MEFNASMPAERPFSDETLKGRVANFILGQRALALAIIMSALGTIGLLVWFSIQNSFATDFSVYWRTANEPLAMAYAPRDELPFPYTPTMLIWISPLSEFPMWPAFGLWVLISVYVLVKACRLYLSEKETWLALASPIVFNGLATGQVSAFLAAVLLWSVGTGNRLLGGLGLALIASVKPQLVVFAPLYMLLRRDWPALWASAVAFAVLVGLSIIAFGTASWFEWVASLSNFHRVLLDQNVLAVAATPAGAAERWGLSPLPFLVVGIAAGCWLIVKCRNRNPLEASAAIAAASLLAAPYALTYDLAAVVPFLVWMIFRGSIASAVAVGGPLHPVPLILTSIELVRPFQGRAIREKQGTSGAGYAFTKPKA